MSSEPRTDEPETPASQEMVDAIAQAIYKPFSVMAYTVSEEERLSRIADTFGTPGLMKAQYTISTAFSRELLASPVEARDIPQLPAMTYETSDNVA